MSMGTIFWILTVIICGVFLIISIKVKDQANESFSQYAIGGSSFPMILIFFTQFATIMGAGNFIGHAGSGYELQDYFCPGFRRFSRTFYL